MGGEGRVGGRAPAVQLMTTDYDVGVVLLSERLSGALLSVDCTNAVNNARYVRPLKLHANTIVAERPLDNVASSCSCKLRVHARKQKQETRTCSPA